MMSPMHTPLVLIILDGWGYKDQSQYNAIVSADTPVWNQLWQNYPHTLVEASGLAVGLPDGQMGNSEVGHLHMGAGRLVMQDLTRIDLAIKNTDFFKNPILKEAINSIVNNKRALHIFGLLSQGGVHSHQRHIEAILEMAAQLGVEHLYLHAFLDGRDTPPRSAEPSLLAIEQLFNKLNKGKIASIVGRYYAMDRDLRWERTQKAYDMLTLAKASFQAPDALSALQMAYARGETDEFVQPTCIHSSQDPPIVINDGDAVIFMNFRADRARQLTRAFTEPQFSGFHRQKCPKLDQFVTLTEYAADINARIAFSPISMRNTLGEYVSRLGLKQLRLAETEKYAHVTFFFNCGIEKPYEGEERQLIASPKVATYDLQPQMSAFEVTQELVKAIKKRQYQLIIVNYANPDMLGHTGCFDATVIACEVIDNCLNCVLETLAEVGGEAIITADHGNAECMYDPKTQQPHTAHTTNLVPVIYVGREAKVTTDKGVLYDIAPTLLYLLGLDIPKEMTGKPLFSV